MEIRSKISNSTTNMYVSCIVEQKYPLIAWWEPIKSCETRAIRSRVAAGTRDESSGGHITPDESLARDEEGEGRLGDREGLIRRWFHSRGRCFRWTLGVPLVVTWWCWWWWWWWCYGRLCLAFHSRSTNRDERLHARLGSWPQSGLPCPFLSFPFPSPLFPFFSSFPRTSLLESPPLLSRKGFANYHVCDACVQSSSLVGEPWIVKIKVQSCASVWSISCGCLCKFKFLWI